MTTLSTAVTNGTDVENNFLRYRINLKSRWTGDRNQIFDFRFRAISDDESDVQAEAGQADVTGLDTSVGLFGRPPLMHGAESGLWVRGGSGVLRVSPEDSFQGVAMLIKPITETRISVDGGSHVTMTPAGAGFTMTTSGTSGVYLHDGAWSGTEYFPFQRLLVINWSSLRNNVVLETDTGEYLDIGNTYGGTGAVDEFVVNRIMFSYDPIDAATLSTFMFRKPYSASTVTEPGVSGDIVDGFEPLPDSWVVVDSN